MGKPRVSFSGWIFIAMALGIAFGAIVPGKIMGLEVIGDVFIRLIQMSIVLLIMGQVTEAVGRLDIRQSGRIIGETIVVFLVSSLLAAGFGVLIAALMKPGVGTSLTIPATADYKAAQMPGLATLIRDFFPSNIVEAMAKGNVVQTIVFALCFGAALSQYLQKHPETVLLKGLEQFNAVVIDLIRGVMKLAPIGVFALIATSVGAHGLKVILPMFKYLGVYALGTLIFLGLWLLVVSGYTRVRPMFWIKRMMRMSTVALATTSSAVTLPVELEDAQAKLGLHEQVSQIVLNLGMSLNSNGSAMHMALTIVTIAQLYGIDYSPQTLLYVTVLATLSSLANAVVPGAALVSLTIVVPQMGLPVASIALFAGIDWFVGMLRTILNVDSDVFSAILVAKRHDMLTVPED